MLQKGLSGTLLALTTLYLGGGALQLSAQSHGPVEVGPAVHSDISPPLGSIKSAQTPGAEHNRDKPLHPIPQNQIETNGPDGALQTNTAPAVSTAGGLGIPGVGRGDYGFNPDAAPPDTNGAVGATQYVQWVNESFAVF